MGPLPRFARYLTALLADAEEPMERRGAEPATEELKESAEVMEVSSIEQTDSADRRTELAANRTVLAAERTYAAWVRTGLAALAAGVGAQALLEEVVPGWLTRPTGSALVLFSGFCFVAAVWRELRPGAPPPRPDTRRMPAVLLIAINGFLVFVSLMALVGVWLAPG
jgi:putative membrane protein